MASINVLRYSAAKTKAAILAEVATANSKDHGTGANYGGLCVVVEVGQEFDALPLVPSDVKPNSWMSNGYNRLSAVIDSAAGLEATLCTNAAGNKVRTMWRLTIDDSDIIGLADRYTQWMGIGDYQVDGVVIRKGAKVIAAAKVTNY